MDHETRLRLTVHTGVVWLYVCLLDFAILDDEGVSLAAWLSEDFRGVKVKTERLGELGMRVC